jgi:tubulin---tyrosine ligase
MEANYHLSNKKALFWNMTQYYKRLGRNPFDNLPLTFHIETGTTDQEWAKFKNYFSATKEKIKR